MSYEGSRNRLKLVQEAESAASSLARAVDAVGSADLLGLDFHRLPQELAGQVPRRGAPWPRGTCLPPVDTPDGRLAFCFGKAEELTMVLRESCAKYPVNSARTLWVVKIDA